MKKTPENIEKAAIKDYLNYQGGCFYYPNTAGLGSKPGIPDITAIIDGQVFQIEVKAGRGKQSPKQKEFQVDWERAGGIYILGGLTEVINQIKIWKTKTNKR